VMRRDKEHTVKRELMTDSVPGRREKGQPTTRWTDACKRHERSRCDKHGRRPTGTPATPRDRGKPATPHDRGKPATPHDRGRPATPHDRGKPETPHGPHMTGKPAKKRVLLQKHKSTQIKEYPIYPCSNIIHHSNL